MRAVADHEIGAGIDGGVGDLAHVGHHLLVQAPMAGGDDDIGPCAQ